MGFSIRLAFACLVTALAAACASAPDLSTHAPAGTPRLVVFIVVDGLPQRQVLAYRDQLAPDGFARFLDRGAWFSNAYHGHAFTVTAAGHATMLTGAYPHRTGIIGNEWRDPLTGAAVYNTDDTSARYIGHTTGPLDGTSPKRLKVETLGDVLRRADSRSRVIGISGKDRGAILTAGKTGTAYMYIHEDGQFASSTYYMKEHPPWVQAFNRGRPADRYFKALWRPLLPEGAYERSVPDGQAWFSPAGARLPMQMGAADAAPGTHFYESLLASPFIDVLTLDFALAAIDGEQLGRGGAPDILALSLSGHDYVNHAYSAESRLSHDHLLQLDRLLQSFLRDLDARLGKDSWIAVLTADHGFTPAMEYSLAHGRDTGQFDPRGALAHINEGLARKFGEGRWCIGYSAASLLLDRKLAAQRHVDIDALAQEARDLLMAEAGVDAAFTRLEMLTASRREAPHFEALRNSWHPDVSGEVQFTLKPDWTFGSGAPASHGSPHEADTHVPIMFYGPRWIAPGRIDTRVEVVDLAPTLARMLGVAAPSASEGKLLPLAAP